MHYSRTALRELKKRYLNILKKCFLLNMMLFSTITLSSPTIAGESIGTGETKEYSNKTFEGNTTTTHGGALDIEGTVDLVTGNTFKSNTAQIGGAVFVHDKATLNSTSSTYESNTATGVEAGSNGGAIQNSGTLTSTGDTFTKNSSDNGGAIAQTETTSTSGNETQTFPAGTMTIENGTFTENTATTAGGAIYNDGKATIKGTTAFNSNTATTQGGAIDNIRELIIEGTGVTFTGNTADNGGAIVNLTENATINSAGATFTNNKATAGSGGAIYNATGATYTSNGDTFTGNSAFDDGGAIYNQGTMQFSGDTTFTNNSASDYGGAIYNYTNSTITFGENSTATFTDNSATNYGGAIHNYGTITFGGLATFERNSTTDDGGAISNRSMGTITFGGDATFEGNSATVDGGAIHNAAGTITFTGDTTFTENSATDRGGAIYNEGIIAFTKDTTFTDNSAETGGAIWNAGTITFGANATFTNSSASSNGSTISNNGTIEFGGITIFDKTFNAISNTGFITFGKGSTATFTNNSGGAIKNGITTITFNGKASFENNSAETGGAISNIGTITFNDNFLFSGNTANEGADISNIGTINFAPAENKVGTLDGGIFNNGNNGTINKTGAGTLILGDKMVNGYDTNYNSQFNQSAGLTIAGSDTFNIAKNNIFTGGTLETHGQNIGFNASFTGTDANNKAIWKHYSTGGTTTLNNISLNAYSEAVFDTYTDDIKQAYINTYVPQNDENKLFTINSVTNGTKSTYILGNDISKNGGKATFNNSIVTFGGGTITYAGNYALGSNTSMSTANGTVDHLTFNNLQATEHALSIDFGDIINTTVSSVLFDINTINFNTIDSVQNAVSYQALMGGATFASSESFELDGILEGLIASVVAGEQYINITGVPSTAVEYNNLGTTIRSDYNAVFKMANSATLTDGIYTYQITTADQHPTNPVANSMGKVGTNTKNILGATNVASQSVIQANGYNVLEYNTTSQGDVTLKNITLDGAKNVVHVTDSGKATVNLNNVIVQNGTDSAISNAGDLTINASNGVAFTGNTATQGGAIKTEAGSTLTMTGNATFEGNTATTQGGALDIEGTIALGTGNTFKSNTAQIGGAVFIHDKATLNSTNSTYESNTATGVEAGSNGGAIQNSGTLTSTGDTFTKNSSDNGGAIAQTETTSTSGNETQTFPAGTMTIENGTFTENTATTAGGAIYNDGKATIKGTTAFNSNTATTQGGAIDNIRELIIEGTGVTFTGNTADNGGAIVNLTENATINSAGATFTENKATAGSGGAIYNAIGATYTSNGDTFTGNTSKYGGAIYNQGTMVFNGDTTFTDNSAFSEGGAIYNSYDTITFSRDAIFINNLASSYGGAIKNAATITFEESSTAIFTNNSASSGGAIWNYGATLTFKGDATFTRNTATKGSGAISNVDHGIITFDGDTTFTDNSASSGGAISAGGIITFNDNFLFSGNTANEGADIYNTGTINFAPAENKVGTLDGGIYQADNNNAQINKTGAGTLILGDEMANSGSGTFAQSEGLTIAHVDKLNFATTNTVTGGELRVHGNSLANLNATVSNGAMLTYLTTNADEQTVALPSGLTINNAQLVLGAYTNSAKQAEVNLASSKLVPELDENGDVVYNDDGSIKYTAYDVTGKLLTTGTISKANYKLNSDIATETGATLVTFKDSNVTFGGGTITYAGNYALGSNTSMSTANGTVDHLTFNNLQATEHALSIDFGDIIDTTVSSVLFDINTINFNTIDSVQNAVSYQALMGGATFASSESFELDGILEGLIASVVAGEQYINITGVPSTAVEYNNLGTTIRSDYNAVFKMANSGTLTDGIYTYQITTADQHPTNPVANSMGKVGTNTKNILGATNVASQSVIQANGYNVLEYNTTTHGDVTLKNLTLDGAKNVVHVTDSGKATVNLNNVIIQNGTASAISNAGNLTINASNGVAFTDNTASHGGAIHNSGTIEFGEGSANASNGIAFTDNTASYVGAIYNSGTIEFGEGSAATFTNNSATGNGGAIYNKATITFGEGSAATFTNNSAKYAGGAIYNENGGTITFGEGSTATFTGNYTSSMGGAIYNDGTIEFGEGSAATFTGNHASSLGGAIRNYVKNSTITFDGDTTFTGNYASSFGGAIYNSGTITFSNNFLFSGNTANQGADIYNTETINFAPAENKVGTLDGGITNADTINKTGAGTLVLGDKMVNGYDTNYNSQFNQSAGLTIAGSDTFNIAKNNIFTGGTLETHGQNIGFNASFTGTDANNKAIWKHYSTGGTTTLDNISLNTYSEAVFDTYTDDIKQAYINTYVPQNDENTLFTVNSVANGTKSTYILGNDISKNGGKATFNNSIIKFGTSSYTGAYEIGSTNTIDMQNNTAENVTFDNLMGNGATLNIDVIFKQVSDTIVMSADKFITNGSAYQFKDVSINMVGQSLLDGILSNLTTDQMGTFNPAITYQATVLGGNATFEESKTSALTTASPYVYEIKTSGQELTVSANKLKDTPLVYLTKYAGDTTLQMVNNGSGTTYTMGENETLDTMATGDKKVLGVSTIASDSLIKSNGKDMFTLNNQDTTLTVEDITIDGASNVVNNQKGTVEFDNVVIQNTVGDTSIKNADKMTLANVQVDKSIQNTGALTATNLTGASKIENTGALTANKLNVTTLSNTGQNATVTLSNTNTIGTLENNSLTTMNDGMLSVSELSGSGTLTMNNSILDATSITTDNTIISNNMDLSDRLTNLNVKALEIKANSTLDLKNATATVTTINNAGDLIANKDLTVETLTNNASTTINNSVFKVSNLSGAGRLNMNNATLDVANGFSSSNKLFAHNLTLGNRAKELSFAEVAVQENSFLDIGKATLYSDIVHFNDNSKLITHINTLSDTEFGKISANTINVSDVGTELSIIVAPGEHFTSGYKNYTLLDAETLNADAENGFAKISENTMYDIYYLGDGAYQLCAKGSSCPLSPSEPTIPSDTPDSDTSDSDDLDDDNTPPTPPQPEKPNTQRPDCTGYECVLDAWILGPAIDEEGKAKDIQDTLNDMVQILGKDSERVKDAVKGLAPDTSALIQSHSLEIINRLSSIVSKQLRSASERTGYIHNGYRFYKYPNKESRAWVQTIYGQSKTTGDKAFDVDTQGIALGFDAPISDHAKLGLAYSYTTADGTAVQRDVDITSHAFMLYGEYHPNRTYVNWQALYARSAYDEDKKVFHHQIGASYDVDVLSAQVIMGRKMGPYVSSNWATGVISPEIGLRYTYLKRHGYQDEASQDVASSDTHILTGILGANYSIAYRLSPNISWYPEFKIAATYDLIEPEFENNVTVANGETYQLNAEALDRFGIEIGARLGLDINRKTEFALEYEGLFKGDYENHNTKASLKYKF